MAEDEVWEIFGGKPFLVFLERIDPLESKSAGCTCDTLGFFLKFKMADGGHIEKLRFSKIKVF